MQFDKTTAQALAAAFPEDEVEFLPRAPKNGKALGLPYIDARDVMRRLDSVVGPDGWSFDFDPLTVDGKMVRGRLTVLGVTKCDAGEASDESELLKSAVSDALKRAAVHFGIGRYLYYLPKVWGAYDEQKRRFTEPPRLDPAAVRRALALCGVDVQRAAVKEEPRKPVPPRPAAPESGGDQAAQQPEGWMKLRGRMLELYRESGRETGAEALYAWVCQVLELPPLKIRQLGDLNDDQLSTLIRALESDAAKAKQGTEVPGAFK